MYNAMQAHPAFATTDFSRTKATTCGAESVPESLLRAWYDRGVVIQEGFGMTETAAACLALDKKDIPHKIGSAGKPGRYWDAYRVTNKIELMASEVSLDLHGIDIALGEEGKP